MNKRNIPSSPHVFVCYTRADAARIAPIVDALRLAGIDIWRDMDGIDGASFWRKEIVQAISTCSLVLLFASKHACHSENVSKELALANEEHKSILPIYLDKVRLPAELRYQIAGVQHILWRGDKEHELQQIIDSVKYYLQQRSLVRPLPRLLLHPGWQNQEAQTQQNASSFYEAHRYGKWSSCHNHA